jgi:large subunit ribosomal protein L13
MKKIDRKLIKLDAADISIGRLASKIALILRGKNKPDFNPSIDNGDIVEISNIGNIKITGKKMEQKKYYHYSGYQSGLKTKKMSDVFKRDPGEVLRRAVRDMLPPTRLRNNMLKRLIIK